MSDNNKDKKGSQRLEKEPSQPTPQPEKSDWLEKLANFASSILIFIWDLFKTALIVAIIAFSVRYFLIEPFIVQGASMEPNFHNLDYLLVEKVDNYLKDDFERGSVVIFHPPNNPSQNYIKRIIGLPNEEVFIRNNQVIIQNKKHPQGFVLKENYLKPDTNTEGTVKVELNNDEYYLMGDNRDNSKDSRSFGPVPEKNIIGTAWLAVYSTAGPKLIKQPSY